MRCPHCSRDIDDAVFARHLAGKGGRRSRRGPQLRCERCSKYVRWPGLCRRCTIELELEEG